jgi:hypothetical protein
LKNLTIKKVAVVHHISISLWVASVPSEDPRPHRSNFWLLSTFINAQRIHRLFWRLPARDWLWECHSDKGEIPCCAAEFRKSKVKCVSVTYKLGTSHVIIHSRRNWLLHEWCPNFESEEIIWEMCLTG